ncbi:MAG: hypothetical protein AAFX99_28075, partial [Myxococcota bacterium]
MRQLVYGLAHSLCLAMLMVPQMALAQTVEDDRVDADDEDDDRVDVEDDDRVDAEEGDDAFS